MIQQEEMDNSNLWLAELRSLGIFVDYRQMTSIDGFKDNKELQYLVDYVKKKLYQQYKEAYSEPCR